MRKRFIASVVAIPLAVAAALLAAAPACAQVAPARPAAPTIAPAAPTIPPAVPAAPPTQTEPVAPAVVVPPQAAIAPAPVAVTPNYRERPRFPMDPQRLKRRPTLDGVIGEGEWDPLYTVSTGPVTGPVYLSWDEEFLYVAAHMDLPGWMILNVDARGDGWLRGADNLEVIVGPLSEVEAAPIGVRLLDAQSNRDAPVWNDRVVNPEAIQIVQRASGAGQVIEMAIPAGVAGVTPRLNAQLGCRVDFLPAGVTVAPTEPYEPRLLLDVTLVESRSVGAPGIVPRLSLEDAKVIPGQRLVAHFDLMNQVDEERRLRSVSWQGEGPAADILKSVREVSLPPMRGLRNLRLRYSAPIPDTAVPGFYQLTVRAEMEDGRTVASTTSFQVTEAMRVQIAAEPPTVTVLGPTEFRAFVEVLSAVAGHAKGQVEIDVPAGWTVRGRSSKDFVAQREDRVTRPVFFVTVPSSAEAGEYMLHATVTWRGRTWKAHRSITVNRPSAPAASTTSASDGAAPR
ncbi:MAG TPA: NEW3 domain-containing protein [Chthonomonadales bacterium]|nr:NEW3 domain-containing protein [Chthonomonadales bacterium]